MWFHTLAWFISLEMLLLLDTYKANHMVEVAHRVNHLGCAIELVPSACSGISQPIDTGVRSPFKSILKRKWLDWLHEQEISADSAISPPTRPDIANWIVSAWNELSSEVVKISFRHRPFHFVEYLQSIKPWWHTTNVGDCIIFQHHHSLQLQLHIQRPLEQLVMECFSVREIAPCLEGQCRSWQSVLSCVNVVGHIQNGI